MPIEGPDGQRYEITFTAEGEVRDADGNLLNQEPIKATAVLTEEQAKALMPLLTDDEGDPQ